MFKSAGAGSCPGGPRCCAADLSRIAEIRRNVCKSEDISELERPSRMGQLEIARNLWQNCKMLKDLEDLQVLEGIVGRIWKFCRFWKDLEDLQI